MHGLDFDGDPLVIKDMRRYRMIDAGGDSVKKHFSRSICSFAAADIAAISSYDETRTNSERNG